MSSKQELMSFNQSSEVKVDRKTLRRPDQFMELVSQFFSGLSKNRRTMGIILGIGATLGALWIVLDLRSSSQVEAGRNALFAANKTFVAEFKALPEIKALRETAAKEASAKDKAPKNPAANAEETPIPASAHSLKMDVDQKLPKTVAELKNIAQTFDSTPAGVEAMWLLAGLYFDHGDSAKAATWYEMAASKSAKRPMDKALAFSAWATALENLQQWTKAAEIFEKALNQGDPGVKGDALLGMARCQEALKNGTLAKSLYDRILAEMPNTDYAKTAQLLKNKLK